MDPHITYGMGFLLWESVVAAGGTLRDLYDVERGEFPRSFLTKVIAWAKLHSLVELHTQDAVARKPRRKG